VGYQGVGGVVGVGCGGVYRLCPPRFFLCLPHFFIGWFFPYLNLDFKNWFWPFLRGKCVTPTLALTQVTMPTVIKRQYLSQELMTQDCLNCKMVSIFKVFRAMDVRFKEILSCLV
jgi:hypothetical protein